MVSSALQFPFPWLVFVSISLPESVSVAFFCRLFYFAHRNKRKLTHTLPASLSYISAHMHPVLLHWCSVRSWGRTSCLCQRSWSTFLNTRSSCLSNSSPPLPLPLQHLALGRKYCGMLPVECMDLFSVAISWSLLSRQGIVRKDPGTNQVSNGSAWLLFYIYFKVI